MAEDERYEIVQRLTRIEEKMENFIKDKSLENRVNRLESNQQWLWRMLITGIFTTLLSVAVAVILKVKGVA